MSPGAHIRDLSSSRGEKWHTWGMKVQASGSLQGREPSPQQLWTQLSPCAIGAGGWASKYSRVHSRSEQATAKLPTLRAAEMRLARKERKTREPSGRKNGACSPVGTSKLCQAENLDQGPSRFHHWASSLFLCGAFRSEMGR